MCQPKPTEETSRPRENLQIRRIYEDITETASCEKCKAIGSCCFEIEGFPNSKLCQPCGIYSTKYPTTFISKDVWTEPRNYRVRMCILHVLLSVWIIAAPYLLGVQNDVLDGPKFAFVLYFMLLAAVINCVWSDSPKENVRKLLESFVSKVEDWFGLLVSSFFLADADYVEDAMQVAHHKIERNLSQQMKLLTASGEQVTRLTNELDDQKKETAALIIQLRDFQEKDCSRAETMTKDVAKHANELEYLKKELADIKRLVGANKEKELLQFDTMEKALTEHGYVQCYLKKELVDLKSQLCNFQEKDCTIMDTITRKATKQSNELDGLKTELVDLKRRLRDLEEEGSSKMGIITKEVTERSNELDDLKKATADLNGLFRGLEGKFLAQTKIIDQQKRELNNACMKIDYLQEYLAPCESNNRYQTAASIRGSQANGWNPKPKTAVGQRLVAPHTTGPFPNREHPVSQRDV